MCIFLGWGRSVLVSTVDLGTINEGDRGTIEFPRERRGRFTFLLEKGREGEKGDGSVSDVRCDDGDDSDGSF